MKLSYRSDSLLTVAGEARLFVLIVVAIALIGMISSGALAETRHSFRDLHKNKPRISSLIKKYRIDSELQEKQKMSPGDIISSAKMEQQDEIEKDFGVLPAIVSKAPQQYRQNSFKKTIITLVRSRADQKVPSFYGIEVVDGKVFGVQDVIVSDENDHYAKELSLEFEKRYGTPDEKDVFSGEQALKHWERYVFTYNIIHENKSYLFRVFFIEEVNPNRTLVVISLSNIEQIYNEFEEKAKADSKQWKEKGENRERRIKETIERAFPQ
ncbi:MAG: hypothetical protein HQL03_04335 [Nitrospirae bacterium]|nr:hypothetical protein [Nitrospirota bacterium]MBF0592367.1 hypothetical protein [Nitrospirota bacterium]